LWIHATSKKPETSEIKEVEKMYKEFYKSLGKERPPFPWDYPTSTLLGWVDLIDILSDSEYKVRLQDAIREPSVTAYHFIVRNP
jgi:activating signal cointegrator 1